MDWTDGYTSEWSVYSVNTDTWADDSVIDGVMSVSVSRDGTDSTPLIETGTMELTADSFDWAWCRIYMTASQGDTVRIPMATLLFEKQSSRVEKGARTISARGRSVLQPAADVKLARGSYAPAGADGAAHAAALIADCTPAPVVVHGSFTLTDDVVFDLGSSALDAAWLLLNAGNWCMQVEGDGTIHVLPMPTEPSLELDRANAGLLIPGVDDDFSIVDIPNRYYAVSDSEVAVAVNEDGVAGHIARGRWVDVVDSSPVLVDGESLEMYAARKLREASTITRKYSYTREFWPDVVPFSMVRATLPANGIEGNLRVLTQSLTCGKGVTVSEVAGMEVMA